MQDGIYHAAIWLPADLAKPIVGAYDYFEWSNHAKAKLLAQKVSLRGHYVFYPVEVEVRHGIINKTTYRGHYSLQKDLCLVVSNQIPPLVITAWLNNYWDNHDSLYKDRYEKAPG